jgi:hypothetical protein
MSLTKITLFFILLLSSSCAIFNSGTVHIKYTDVRADFEGVRYENEEKWGNISVSIRGVQHPKIYGPWNINLSLDPSIHYDRQSFTTTQTFVNEKGDDERYSNIHQSRLSLLGNLKLTTHTPIGIFTLSGGFGEGLAKIRGGMDTIKTVQMRKIDFTYGIFLTERIFLLIGPRYYKENHDEFLMALRIGYFWGEL